MRRILRFVALGLGGLMALPAPALDEGSLRALASRDEGRAFAAIGKLDLGGAKFCTATLITPRLVLTAAHCLIDAETGGVHEVADISFRAGLRDGRAESLRGARRVVVHPGYVAGRTDLAILARDLALVELDRAISSDQVRAIALGYGFGTAIGIVSYRFDQAERPTLQDACRILGQQHGAIVTSCDVDFGASGAPILSFDATGTPRLVSVVSAKARIDGSKVAIGTDLHRPLGDLTRLLSEAGDGVIRHGAPAHARLGARETGAAKFVRP